MPATFDELQSLRRQSTTIPATEPVPEVAETTPHTFRTPTIDPITPVTEPAPVAEPVPVTEPAPVTELAPTSVEAPISIPTPDPSPSAQILSLSELQAMMPEESFADRAASKTGELTVEALDDIYNRILGTDVSDPQALERLVTTLFGSMSGAQAGARIPGPPIVKGVGILVGAVTGVALGTLVPESILRGLEAIKIIPEGQADKVVLSWEELETVLRGEILLETVTMGGASLLKLGGRLTAQLATGMTKEGRRLAELGHRLGIDLMSVQIGDYILGKAYVSVMGRFPLVGKPIKARGDIAEKQFLNRIEGLPNEVQIPELIAPLFASSDLGIRIFNDSKNLLTGFNKWFKSRYVQVWEDAERLGVGVRPEHTIYQARKIIDDIAKKTTQGVDEALAGTSGKVDEVYKKLTDWLEEHILKMEKFTPGEEISYIRREQTLRQMDGLASSVDRFRKTLEPRQVNDIKTYLKRIKIAVLQDMTSNTFGRGAEEIAARVREIDKDFTFVMAQFFETSTAKILGKVHKGGIRRIEFDSTTMRNVDELAKAIIKVNSPNSMRELQRIVEPATFRAIKASILYDALRPTTEQIEKGIRFDASRFERGIGFDSKTSAKRKTFEDLFRTGNVTIKDVEKFIDIGKKLSSIEIPNVSTFIARRAVLQGRQGIWGAFIIGGSASATSGYDSGGFLGLAMNTVLFVGGLKMLSAVLSNPVTARAFLRVADVEASVVQKRAAIMRIVRITAERIGTESLLESAQETYETIYPGEGNISEPIKELFLPEPGITEEQKQSGTLRQEDLKIAEILKYANGYISLGLGITPPEPSELTNSLLPTFHKGGLITKDSGLKQLAEKYDTIPDIQRDKQLRQLHHYNNKTFNQLLEYLENR